jgi:transposase
VRVRRTAGLRVVGADAMMAASGKEAAMNIRERDPGDLAQLRTLVRREKNAEQKDRLLAVVHALGGRETKDIQEAISRSRGFVQRWVYAYRDGGIDAVRSAPRGGSRPKLDPAHLPRLRERLDAGPTEADGVCTLRGRDVQRIIDREFGVKLSLNGAYRVLHKLNYTCLAPRQRHEHQDAAAQEKFRDTAPFLFRN